MFSKLVFADITTEFKPTLRVWDKSWHPEKIKKLTDPMDRILEALNSIHESMNVVGQPSPQETPAEKAHREALEAINKTQRDTLDAINRWGATHKARFQSIDNQITNIYNLLRLFHIRPQKDTGSTHCFRVWDKATKF